ncbi:MAG: DNA-binding protein YbiB [Zoogloeaceae bacterium]|nr:DNA-binding protein YbiB [Zoogloeaceae bacterium]
MNLASCLREIGRGGAHSLASDAAAQLYAAILDGGVPELELGAILMALRMRGETSEELFGFLSAAEARIHALTPPASGFAENVRVVVLSSYNGARKSANLTPLLALLLRRFGVPVLVHGLLEGFGRVTSAQVFRELGILPAGTQAEAQQQLDQGLAFVPLPALSPALAGQLLLRVRLGVRNCAHSLVKMLNPVRGKATLVVAATHPATLEKIREVLTNKGETALLMRATEGEPFANLLRRPRMELLCEGEARILFEAEHDSLKTLPWLPENASAPATAAWIGKVLDDHLPLPLPLANQLVCLLYASGLTRDLNEARALVSLEQRVRVSA